MHAHTGTQTRTHACKHIHTSTHIHACKHTRTHTYTYTYGRTTTHTQTHIYTHTRTHTHTRTIWRTTYLMHALPPCVFHRSKRRPEIQKNTPRKGSYEQRRSDIDFYICNMNAACVQKQRISVMHLPDSYCVHRTWLCLFTRAIKDKAATGVPWQQTNKFNKNPCILCLYHPRAKASFSSRQDIYGYHWYQWYKPHTA